MSHHSFRSLCPWVYLLRKGLVPTCTYDFLYESFYCLKFVCTCIPRRWGSLLTVTRIYLWHRTTLYGLNLLGENDDLTPLARQLRWHIIYSRTAFDVISCFCWLVVWCWVEYNMERVITWEIGHHFVPSWEPRTSLLPTVPVFISLFDVENLDIVQ